MSGDGEILRDRDRRMIGEIVTTRDNIQTLRNRDGRTLGEYDPEKNVTWDRDGRRIGEGNLLVSFLRQE